MLVARFLSIILFIVPKPWKCLKLKMMMTIRRTQYRKSKIDITTALVRDWNIDLNYNHQKLY